MEHYLLTFLTMHSALCHFNKVRYLHEHEAIEGDHWGRTEKRTVGSHQLGSLNGLSDFQFHRILLIWAFHDISDGDEQNFDYLSSSKSSTQVITNRLDFNYFGLLQVGL